MLAGRRLVPALRYKITFSLYLSPSSVNFGSLIRLLLEMVTHRIKRPRSDVMSYYISRSSPAYERTKVDGGKGEVREKVIL